MYLDKLRTEAKRLPIMLHVHGSGLGALWFEAWIRLQPMDNFQVRDRLQG